MIPRARKNFLLRFWRKYLLRLPAVYYRGELQVIIKLMERRPADLMHIYFGHTGVHLLPFIKEWEQPCVVSFHGMDIQPRPEQSGYDEQMRDLLQTAAAGAGPLPFADAAVAGDGMPAGETSAESDRNPA